MQLIYKQKVSTNDARKLLTLSNDEDRGLRNTITKKFRNPVFISSLKQFAVELNGSENFSLRDTAEKMKEIEKYQKNN